MTIALSSQVLIVLDLAFIATSKGLTRKSRKSTKLVERKSGSDKADIKSGRVYEHRWESNP